MARRAAIDRALGSALEWIDFTAYGAVAATVLPTQFFPTMDPSTAILASFATFGVGNLRSSRGRGTRHPGRSNRAQRGVYTLILMGVASFLIGLLPITPAWDYGQWEIVVVSFASFRVSLSAVNLRARNF